MGLLASPTGKWLGFVTAIWVQSISGNNYTFSNYSNALKTLMGLSQLQLNNLSVAKDIGKAFGLLAGLASDRFSTPVLLLIGSLEGLVGYGVQWLVVSQKIQPLSYWKMCIFLCMGGNSTTWMNTAVLVTCIRNFRKNRGPVSGILKGYIGLSTAIFTDLCTALFSDSPSSFLLMLALIPAVVCLTSIVLLREVSTQEGEDVKEEERYFTIFNGVAVIVAVYLLIFDLTGPHGRLVSQGFAAGLLLLMAVPLGVPLHSALRSHYNPKSNVEEQTRRPLIETKEEESQEKDNNLQEVKENAANNFTRKPVIGEEHTIWEVITTVDFWVLFVSFLCGVGTGLAVMNNLGQMGSAMGYKDVSIFVSLTSIWGFFGRLASGSLSEYFITKSATPRPLWNAASQILMGVGYVVMALSIPGSLYIGSILVGVCYGVRIAITVPLASELFGLKYYGLIYNILILNLPLGSFLFSGLLAGILYDSQATRIPGGGTTCFGAHCYRLVFVVMAFTCVIGFGLDLLLTWRTKTLYAKISATKNSRKTRD